MGGFSGLKSVGGSRSLKLSAYMATPKPSCLRLLVQLIRCALFLVLAKAGKSRAARIAMMAMTTSNSISVKAELRFINDYGFAPVGWTNGAVLGLGLERLVCKDNG